MFWKNRKGLKNVRMINGKGFGKLTTKNSGCTGRELRIIDEARKESIRIIKRTWKHWKTSTFKKWFGKGTAHSNENVKLRYKFAMDFMEKPANYKMVCCKKLEGGCASCSNAHAFVNVGFNKKKI